MDWNALIQDSGIYRSFKNFNAIFELEGGALMYMYMALYDNQYSAFAPELLGEYLLNLVCMKYS